MMKKLCLVSLGALVSLTAFAQDLLECVNPDIVRGVLFYGRSESQMSLSPNLPPAMAGFEAPAAMTLIGAASRTDGAQVTVAYATDLQPDAAYAAMLGAFESEGWVIEEPMVISAPVFVIDGGQPVSGTICRDGERRYLSVEDGSVRRYASVMLTDQPTTRACNAEDPRRGLGFSMMTMMTSQAPSLQMPEGTTAADGSGRLNQGGGGSGDTYQTDSQIRSPLPAASFMSELATQMSAQGWDSDSRWSGNLSHGGRWTRTADDGTFFWTTLELVDIGDGLYDLSFRIMMPPL